MTNRATGGGSGSVPELLAAVGSWSSAGGPLYRSLARAIAGAVERGALGDGVRLPSERELAEALAIGRGTAAAVYDALVVEGLVRRRRGSGTFVAVSDQPALPAGREGSALVQRLVERSEPNGAMVDLSLSVLGDASFLPPLALGSADLRTVTPDTGYTPWGLPPLRRAPAAELGARGLATREEQVVVTTGAQQAISMAAACWVRPGDAVVVEDPTYPGALAAFTQAGARLLGVPLDDGGVRVGALRKALEERPALVYLQSSVHSPTGTVLAAGRRAEIVALVTERHVPLVEDVALVDLTWGAVPPPIAAQAPTASTAVVGSLSKRFWGGLRVGYVRAPEPLALRLARIKATRDLGSSAVSQLLAAQLLERAAGDPFEQRRRDVLRARHDQLGEALRHRLPGWTWRPPAGGLSLWVDLRAPSEPFAQHALRTGVAVATSGVLSPSGQCPHHLRLSFSGPPDELEEGVARLATAWRTWRA